MQGYLGQRWALAAVVGPTLGGVFADYAVVAVDLLGQPADRRRGDVDARAPLRRAGGAGARTGSTCWAPCCSPSAVCCCCSPCSRAACGGPGPRPRASCCSRVAVCCSAASCCVETRAAEPVLPLWVFRHRVILPAILISLVVGVLLMGITSYIPLFAQGVLGHGAVTRRVRPRRADAGLAAGGVERRAALPVHRVPGRRSLIGAVIALGGSLLLLTIDGDSSLLHVAAPCFVMGFGFGFAAAPVGDRGPVGGRLAVPRRHHRRHDVRPLGRAARSAWPASVPSSTPGVTDRIGHGSPDLEQLSPSVLEPAIHATFVATAIIAVALVLVSLLMPRADRATPEALSASAASPSLRAARRRGDDAAMSLPDEIDRCRACEAGPHEDEPHEGGINNRLNWLRAGVLGANDGIVSTAGIVMGVAGATSDRGTILVAGVAGLAAGALSMAAGEYVSVSTQKDSELALLDKERRELREEPAGRARGARRAVRREGAQRGARPRRSPRSSPSTTRSPRTPRPSSASTPTTSPARGTPRSPRWSPSPSGALLPLLTITLVAPDFRVWVTVASVDAGAGADRLGQRAVRLRAPRPGGAPQRRRRAVRDGGHLRDRIGARARTSAEMRLFAALVPPAEALDHLDAFLDVRREAGELPLGPGRPGPRHAGLPRRRCRTGSSTTSSSGSVERRPGVPRSRPRSSAAAPSRTSGGRRCCGPGSTSTSPAAPSWTGWPPAAGPPPNRAGIEVDGARFRPHLTAGAGPGPRTTCPAGCGCSTRYAGPRWRADEVTLVESHLGEGPRGRPRHVPVDTFPLTPRVTSVGSAPVRIAVARETREGETRVAMVPELVGKLTGLGYEVAVEPDAGRHALLADEEYVEAGAVIDADAIAVGRRGRLGAAARSRRAYAGSSAARRRCRSCRSTRSSRWWPTCATWARPRSRWSWCRGSRGPSRWTRCRRRRWSPATAARSSRPGCCAASSR